MYVVQCVMISPTLMLCAQLLVFVLGGHQLAQCMSACVYVCVSVFASVCIHVCGHIVQSVRCGTLCACYYHSFTHLLLLVSIRCPSCHHAAMFVQSRIHATLYTCNCCIASVKNMIGVVTFLVKCITKYLKNTVYGNVCCCVYVLKTFCVLIEYIVCVNAAMC